MIARYSLLLAIALSACSREAPQETGEVSTPSEPAKVSTSSEPVAIRSKVGSVVTTFYPTAYFAQRIAGDLLEISCPLPEEEDPIYWMPNASALQRYQAADLILLNGAEFEKWVGKVSLPSSRVVKTAAAFKDEFVTYEKATTHRHGPEGEHTHEGIDGHTWVDPLNALAQAESIAARFAKRWPEHAEAFSEGLKGLETDLRDLDKQLSDFAGAWGKRPLLASHPAYNYLIKRYGFAITNLDLDPEEMNEAAYHDLDHHADDHGVKILLWEGKPSKVVAERMESLGIRNVLFTPAEGFPGEGEDYLSLMQGNLDRLEALLD